MYCTVHSAQAIDHHSFFRRVGLTNNQKKILGLLLVLVILVGPVAAQCLLVRQEVWAWRTSQARVPRRGQNRLQNVPATDIKKSLFFALFSEKIRRILSGQRRKKRCRAEGMGRAECQCLDRRISP